MSDTSTVLVTGGAGFMGSHVVEAILQESALGSGPVVVVDDLSGGCRDHVPSDPRVEFVQGDINDSALVTALFERHRFRFVYHLPAYAAEGLSHFIRRFNYGNNLLASVNLINAAINGTFNLGSDSHHSVNELADQVRRAMGVDGETSHLAARHEVHVAYSDHTRARETFPELTDTPLDEGLATMAEWAKTAKIPEPQSFEPLEVERDLPPSWRK